MARDWKFRLDDIVQAIARIERYTGGMDFDAFRSDEKTLDAVIRNLTIVGEAAHRLPGQLKKMHTEVEWRLLTDLRNFVVHEYWGVNLETIWGTILNKLPGLKKSLENILAQISRDAEGS